MINFEVMDINDFYNLESKEKKEEYIQKVKEAVKKSDNEVIKKMANTEKHLKK